MTLMATGYSTFHIIFTGYFVLALVHNRRIPPANFITGQEGEVLNLFAQVIGNSMAIIVIEGFEGL